MRIYLAGRCDTTWRDDILGLKLADLGLQARDLVDGSWPIIAGVIDGTHEYGGAYPVVRQNQQGHAFQRKGRDHTFVHNNLSAIDQCEVVFAWIDRHGLYGTIAEVAYAHAKGKTVWMAFQTPALEAAYWFVSHVGLSPLRAIHDGQAGQDLDVEDYCFTAVAAFDCFRHGTGS